MRGRGGRTYIASDQGATAEVAVSSLVLVPKAHEPRPVPVVRPKVRGEGGGEESALALGRPYAKQANLGVKGPRVSAVRLRGARRGGLKRRASKLVRRAGRGDSPIAYVRVNSCNKNQKKSKLQEFRSPPPARSRREARSRLCGREPPPREAGRCEGEVPREALLRSRIARGAAANHFIIPFTILRIRMSSASVVLPAGVRPGLIGGRPHVFPHRDMPTTVASRTGNRRDIGIFCLDF